MPAAANPGPDLPLSFGGSLRFDGTGQDSTTGFQASAGLAYLFSGTAARIFNEPATASLSGPGIQRWVTGSTNAGMVSLHTYMRSFWLPTCDLTLQARFWSGGSPSTAVERYSLFFGIGGDLVMGSNYGLFFRYRDDLFGGKLHAVSKNGGTESIIEGPVLQPGSLYSLTIKFTGSSGVASFFVNGNQVGSPMGSGQIINSAGGALTLQKNVGATSINGLYFDFFELEYSLSSLRV